MLFSCGTSINVWDVLQPAIPETFAVHGGPIKSIDFNHTTRKGYFSNFSRKLYEFDVDQRVVRECDTIMDCISLVKLSPSGKNILLVDSKQLVALFSLDNFPKLEQIGSHRAHRHRITSIALPGETSTFYAGDESGKVSEYNGEKVKILLGWSSKNGSVKDMVYDFTSNRLIIATNKGIFFRSPIGATVGLEFPLIYEDPIVIRHSSMLATLFAVGFANGTFALFKAEDGKLVQEFKTKGKIISADIDDKGEYIAIAAENDSAYLIHTTDGKMTPFMHCDEASVILRFLPKVFEVSKSTNKTTATNIYVVDNFKTGATPKNKTKISQKTNYDDDEFTKSTTRSSIKNPLAKKQQLSTVSILQNSAQKLIGEEIAAQKTEPKETSDYITNETPKQQFKSRIKKNPSNGSNFDDIVDIPRLEVDHPKLYISEAPVKFEEKTPNPIPKQVPSIADTPPRVPPSPKSKSTSTETQPPTTTKKSQKKLKKIISDSEDSSYSNDEEVSSQPIDNRQMLNQMKHFMEDKFDNLSQQMNTIYLDLLCRIRGLGERVDSIEKSICVTKK